MRQQLVTHARRWTWPPACVPFQPFELVLDQPTRWPHGLAVLGAAEVPAPLQVLHDRLGDALRTLGLPVETRPYQPHVTLARRADAVVVPAMLTPVVWRVRRYVLVVSTGGMAAS